MIIILELLEYLSLILTLAVLPWLCLFVSADGNDKLTGDLNAMFCDFNTDFKKIRRDYAFLEFLDADCAGDSPNVRCDCCTRCF